MQFCYESIDILMASHGILYVNEIINLLTIIRILETPRDV